MLGAGYLPLIGKFANVVLAARGFDGRYAHVKVDFSEGTGAGTRCVGRRRKVWRKIDVEGGAAFARSVDDKILVFARICLSVHQPATLHSNSSRTRACLPYSNSSVQRS